MADITGRAGAGGGVQHGSIVEVDDQAQQFKVALVISDQVTCPPLKSTPVAIGFAYDSGQVS